MTTEFTIIAQTAKSAKPVSFGVSSLPCDRDKFARLRKNYAVTGARTSVQKSEVCGQMLAGTGALVFEGELLEIPTWN